MNFIIIKDNNTKNDCKYFLNKVEQKYWTQKSK